MKICITTIHDRLGVIAMVNRTNKCGLVEAQNKVNNINITPLILDIPQSNLTHLQKYCTFKIIENDMQNQFEFKPFNKVLVRDADDCNWRIELYSHYIDGDDAPYHHECLGGNYAQCIPYNEETKHLVGTSKPYKNSEPKVWKVTCHKNNEVFHFTNDELKHFIENAVINNKDIQWFTTTYEGNNN